MTASVPFDRLEAVLADPLGNLTSAGVSIWLDDLSRTGLVSGSLIDLVRDKHVVGLTSDPTILARAIGAGDLYDE